MTVVRIPDIVEEALWAATRRRLPPEVLTGSRLTAAVVDRSRRYTSDRDQLAAPALGHADADLAARALFFTVADAGKLAVPLAELVAGRAPDGFLGGDQLRVLDVGAGCGAMTLGLCAVLAARGWRGQLTVTLHDRDRAALAIGADAVAQVAAELGVRCAVTVRDGELATARLGGPFELVLAGTVVNELAAPGAAVAAMLAATAPTGVVVIVEPALRATSRALHQLRDELVASGLAAVLAPCTGRGAPCPALADDRDWCHDHRPASLPPRARQIANHTGLRDGDAKWSFLALCRPAAAPAPVAAWRVVDDPHPTKGKHELVACGAPGWVKVRLLRRHRGADNRALERARRGDLLAITAEPIDGVVDLTADDRVELVGAAAAVSGPATPASR